VREHQIRKMSKDRTCDEPQFGGVSLGSNSASSREDSGRGHKERESCGSAAAKQIQAKTAQKPRPKKRRCRTRGIEVGNACHPNHTLAISRGQGKKKLTKTKEVHRKGKKKTKPGGGPGGRFDQEPPRTEKQGKRGGTTGCRKGTESSRALPQRQGGRSNMGPFLGADGGPNGRGTNRKKRYSRTKTGKETGKNGERQGRKKAAVTRLWQESCTK